MAAVAAVLLALAAHAIHDEILGAVMQRIDGRFEQALQRGFIGADERRIRPRINAAPDAHVANREGRVALADMQLQPAQALVVEALEAVHAGAADEAGPTVAPRVEERRAADFV